MKFDFETDAGIGTRATLGAIVLETDETLEPEFAQMMDVAGVALYHSRIPMQPDIRPATLGEMAQALPASASLFPKSLAFDVIGYGCTSAASVIGSDNVARAIRTARPEARVTDPLAAIIAATKALGAKQIGFITPYLPEVSLPMQQKLEAAGLGITAFGSFEEGDDRRVARISESSITAAALQVAKAAACDAIVISCTNLRCLGIIPLIEAKTGVAVIASNQALAWHMLRLSGVADLAPHFGRLFSKPLADD